MKNNFSDVKAELDLFIKNNKIIDLVNSLNIPDDFNSPKVEDKPNAIFRKIHGDFSIELDKRVEKARKAQTIGEYVANLYEEKGKEDPKLIGRTTMTGINKEYKSKLINNRIHPAKDKLLRLAIAFKLNTEETERLLRMAGWSLAEENTVFDTILAFFIEKGVYKITEIDEYLDEYNEPVMFSIK
ncbi:hypothetical protein QGM71_12565 [Virgibacillus sp. C22-A2]|uniref:Appr-1-p processing protein n=1 Tax=Virgibacillus tibetensis TaxID=3042313 RepID=A0ABU6KGM6_9BACI|nr:hypothetical protein [Virgibacillus sp. C22-A2]